MPLVELVESLRRGPLVDEDGHPVTATLLEPMTAEEIAAAEAQLGTPFPSDVRALLAHCRGLDGLLAEIEFSGRRIAGADLEGLFPRVCTIAHDGFGNFWAVDLLQTDEGAWPIWFLCHDPPVALLQGNGLEPFLRELRLMFIPPHASLLDDVHEDRVHAIGRTNLGSLTHAEALASPDETVRGFAGTLGEGWHVVDLRGATPGMGLSWGRFGPRTLHRRLDALPVFALKEPEPRGLLARLRGR